MRTLIASLLVTGLAASAVASPALYWSHNWGSTIYAAPADGSGVPTVVLTGELTPDALASDAITETLFFFETVSHAILSVRVDGSDQRVVAPGLEYPRGLWVDSVGRKLYWVEDGPIRNRVQRSDLNGGSVETLVDFDTNVDLREIEVDSEAGKMYWTLGADRLIQRANLDGTSVEDVVGGFFASGLALDVTRDKLYWTDYIDDKIRRSNLDGSSIEELIITGLDAPWTLALDPNEGKIYWTDGGLQHVARADLDGTNVEVLYQGPIGFNGGITLMPAMPMSIRPESWGRIKAQHR